MNRANKTKVVLVVGGCTLAAFFYRGYLRFGNVNLFAQNSLLCAQIPGAPNPDQGSGACVGNFTYALPLGTTGLSLFYDSYFASDPSTGLKGSWRGSWEAFSWNEALSQVVLADGTILKTRPTTDGFITEDLRVADLFVKRVGSGWQILMSDGSAIDLGAKFGQFFRMTSTTSTVGNKTVFIRDGQGRVTEIQYSLPLKTIKIRYSANRVEFLDPAGSTYSASMTAQGITRVDFPESLFGEYQYDSMGRMTSAKTPSLDRYEVTYDNAGRVVSMREPSGHFANYSYGPGQVVNSIFSDGKKISEEFATIGGLPVVSKVTINGQSIRYGRDATGVLTSLSPQVGPDTRYTYDSQDKRRLLRMEAAGIATTYEYAPGPFRKLAKINTSYPDGRTLVSQFGWEGSLLRYSHNNGRTTKFDYSGNRLIRVTDWMNRITYEASAMNEMKQITSFRDVQGLETRMTYDSNYRLASVTYPTGAKDTFTNDSLGNATQYSNGSVQITATYDALGRPRRISTTSQGRTTNKTFDISSNSSDGSISSVNEKVSVDGRDVYRATSDFGGDWTRKLLKRTGTNMVANLSFVEFDAAQGSMSPANQGTDIPKPIGE